MKRLLAVGALLALTLTACASGRSTAPDVVSSSRLVRKGHFRITATAKTPVRLGQPLAVAVRITNVSKKTRKIQIGYPGNFWFVAHIPHRPQYDTRFLDDMIVGGPSLPATLKPGESVTSRLGGVPVSWSGPLRITPGFDGSALPALDVPVALPSGRLPSDRAALAEVVRSTGHLLDNCGPTSPGVAVTGEIEAPKNSAPPMRARCSVSVEHEDGFLTARVLVFTPPTYRRAHLQSPYEMFNYPKGIPSTSAEAISWLFLVTHNGATSIDGTNMTSTKSGKGWLPDGEWTASGYRRSSGEGSTCGVTGPFGGGRSGPVVDFVSLCR